MIRAEGTREEGNKNGGTRQEGTRVEGDKNGGTRTEGTIKHKERREQDYREQDQRD